MRLRPFTGLVPATNALASSLVSPPYDCVSVSEARDLLAANPSSFLSVVRPDALLPPETSPYADEVYTTARDNLAALVSENVLTPTSDPTIFVYEQADPVANTLQRGLVASVSVADYDADVIKKHEKTRPDKEDDRTRLISTLSAQTGPVFLTYRDVGAVDEVVARTVAAKEPQFHTVADDGVVHRVWPVAEDDVNLLVAAFRNDVPACYIADGHHRAASAARVAREKGARGRGGALDPEDDASWFLGVLFPESHLNLLPYNRVVRDLNGASVDEFLFRLASAGTVNILEEPPKVHPPHGGVVYVFVGEEWYQLVLNEVAGSTDVADRLDCSRLQNSVLNPVLGIDDPRRSERIEFVGGTRGIDFLEKTVKARGDGVAFLMHPVTVGDLMAVSDARELMPPKSTWFAPKLASGFFVKTI